MENYITIRRENTDLEIMQQYRIETLERELKKAKALFKEMILDYEVNEPNVFDKMFNSPINQLNNLYK
jgi:hypothetical protein